MASIFSTPSIYSNHENIGGAIKKRGTVSERKAFQDRNVNQKMQQQLKKPTPLLQKAVTKDFMTVKPKIDEDAWMFEMTSMPVTPVFKETLPSCEERLKAVHGFGEPAMPPVQFEIFLPPKIQPLVFNDDIADETSWDDDIFAPKMPTPSIDDFNF